METRSQKAKKERELSTGARPSSFTGSNIVPVQPKQEHSQVPAPSGGPGPPSIAVQDELEAEADEKLFGDLDAQSEWDLSASCESDESDMGSASGNPSSHIQPPKFSGGKFRDSGRALSFLEDITLYFEVFQFFIPESERDAWLRRSAVLRMTCFPEGSYARTWFSSQFANISTFEQFVHDFTE